MCLASTFCRGFVIGLVAIEILYRYCNPTLQYHNVVYDNPQLRIQPVQRTREGNGLAHVLQSAYPGHGALDAHAESGVRNPAELAQVEIPLEGLFRQFVLMNALQQQIVGPNALRAADDFPVTLGREHIHAEGELRPLRIGLHVERLDGRRIAMHHYRPVELRRDVGFIRRTEVTAPLELVLDQALGMSFLQHLHGLVVGDARKRRGNLLQLAEVAADRLQLGTPLLQASLDDEGNELLRQDHQIVKSGESNLRLDHPELGEMASRLRFLRAEGWPEAVDLAESHCRGFDIKLSRLRQVCLFVEVFQG